MWESLTKDPAAMKRLVVSVLSALAVLLAPLLLKYLGLTVTDTQIEMAAGIIVAFLLQSGAHSIAKANAAGKVEAEKVATVADAAKVLGPQP